MRANGAREYPEGKQGQDIIYSYLLKEAAEDGRLLVFTIERLRGTVGREELTKEKLARARKKQATHPMAKLIPPDAEFDILDERWKGFDIQATRMRISTEELALVIYIAQIPLRREAIQVGVCCGEENQDEGKELLKYLLVNLDGESNWRPDGSVSPPGLLTPTERVSRLATGLGRMILTIVIVLLIVRSIRKSKQAKRAREAAKNQSFPPPPLAG